MLTKNELERINIYKEVVKKANCTHREFISKNSLAQLSRIDSNILTSDFLSLAIPNGEKSVYHVKRLLVAFEKILGIEPDNACFLLGDIDFIQHNLTNIQSRYPHLKIVSVFCTQPNTTEKINDTKVFDISQIENLTERMHVEHWIIACATQDIDLYVRMSQKLNIKKVFINTI